MFEREQQFDTKWLTEREEYSETKPYADLWPSNYKTTMITTYNDGVGRDDLTGFMKTNVQQIFACQ